MVRRLNEDRELAAALQPLHTVTAQAEYLTSFHRRFTEDLHGVREYRPPFVGKGLVSWLEEQVDNLSQLVVSSAAFAEALTKPVHGDLWLNNLLWTSRSDWYLVDWDEVRIGDPAADLAALLGPTSEDLRPLKMQERAESVLTSAELERLHLLGRATLLDWVIDPLSDWIEAEKAPEHKLAVRAEKERMHQRALACYEELYA